MTKNDLNHNSLTARELEVMCLFAEQLSPKEIGEQLHIAEKTVDGILGKAKEKLGLTKRKMLVLYYYKFCYKCCEDCKNSESTDSSTPKSR